MSSLIKNKNSILSKSVFGSKGNASFIIEELVTETIRSKIKSVLGTDKPIYLKFVEFFPIYGICEDTNEKTITKIYMRIRNRDFKRINIREIELAGVTLVEFLDYLEIHGCKEITNLTNLFESI